VERRKSRIAQSIADLEQLFNSLLLNAIDAIPHGASATMQWDDGDLCAHVDIKPIGPYSRHTIRICITEDAVDNYGSTNEVGRLEADARLAHYFAQQFLEFDAGSVSGKVREQPVTDWKITDTMLNG